MSGNLLLRVCGGALLRTSALLLRNAAGGTFTVAPVNLRPDASGNVNFTGTGITVYDPLSNANPALRTPFANNTLPGNRI